MKYLLPLVFLLLATTVRAEELSFEWSKYTDKADGFRIYMDTSDVIIANNIPVTDVEITLTAELGSKCRNIWMRAFRGDLESGNSDIVVACPLSTDPPLPEQPPISMGGFTITVTPN